MVRGNNISRRIIAQIIIDIVLIAGANVTAFFLKYDLTRPNTAENLKLVLSTLPFLIAFRLTALYVSTLYRVHWRYMSIPDMWKVATATTGSSLVFFLFLQAMGYGNQGDYSWGMQIIDWGANIFLLSGVRIFYRHLSDRRVFDGVGGTHFKERQRALIVGAGDSGEAVARDLLRRPEDGLVPVGFVDDDPHKRKIRIHGLPVLGTTHDIPELTEKQQAEIILIASPGASGRELRDIVQRCEQTRARLCIVPNVGDLLDAGSNPAIAHRMRDISVEDLLRRSPVQTDMDGIAKYIAGQRVLITGAGGSIGSELCRQICALNPARLILVGQGENSIFEIEQELLRDFSFAGTAIIGDIKDRDRIEEIFLHERPTVVFHAAAHKHVPLMEGNPAEAVKNNILGTRNVAEIAAQCGVKKFIYVSTDKAVNPTSVMGATKRIGEMLIQSFARTTQTEFAVVRFGNVLGSRGSVIPSMRKQIARGGPVTVTDPAMTRYFMTIPEAVQLILQAGALGRSGEIFILDMGEPVRILDLARDLIRLSGLRPEVDIKIEFTGIRPGEKIFEELLYDSEDKARTPHEKIFISRTNGIVPEMIFREVERLVRLAVDGERDTLRDQILHVARCAFHSDAERAAHNENTPIPSAATQVNHPKS